MNLCIDTDGIGKQLGIQVRDIDHCYHVKSALWATKWPQIDRSHKVFSVVYCCVCYALMQKLTHRSVFIDFNLSLKTLLISLICHSCDLFHRMTEHLYRGCCGAGQHLAHLARMKRSLPGRCYFGKHLAFHDGTPISSTAERIIQ